MRKIWGRRETGMFEDQTERSTRRVSKMSQRAERAGSRYTAQTLWAGMCTTGSQGEDLKHWGDMK